MDRLGDKSKDASVADVMKVLDDGIVAENIVGLSSEPFDEQSLKTDDHLIMDELDPADHALIEMLPLASISPIAMIDENGFLILGDDEPDMLLISTDGHMPLIADHISDDFVGAATDSYLVPALDVSEAGFVVLSDDGFGGEVLVSEPLSAKSGINDSAPVMEPISDIESPDIQALPVPDMPEGWFA